MATLKPIFPTDRLQDIAENDIVMVYFAKDSISPVTVVPSENLHNRHGVFEYSDMIGKRWGTKFFATNKRGFCFLLRPTPELWTTILPHRTQILYNPDISFISLYLDIKPGSKVVEAGTGSGSFSHATARTIGASGRLYTFEFHHERYLKAKLEFESHGLLDRIVPSHRNVCKDGFNMENIADAVFLDLPAPWEAIPAAKDVLKNDRVGRICCFSPCIEQVQRTVTALREAGFSNVTMFETLITSYEQSIYSLSKVDEMIPHIHNLEKRRELKRDEQIKRVEAGRGASSGAASTAGDSEGISGKETPNVPATNDSSDLPPSKKRRKTDHEDDEKENNSNITKENGEEEAEPEDDGTSAPVVQNKTPQKSKRTIPKGPAKPKPTQKVAIKQTEQSRGHTSYLTFATLLPKSYSSSIPSASASTSISQLPPSEY